MDEQGPEQDIYSGKTPEEVLIIISTRSDYWFNLAKGLPKLYAAGFDRNTLEEKINVDAARQNVWTVSAEVFRSLQVCLAIHSDCDVLFVLDHIVQFFIGVRSCRTHSCGSCCRKCLCPHADEPLNHSCASRVTSPMSSASSSRMKTAAQTA